MINYKHLIHRSGIYIVLFTICIGSFFQTNLFSQNRSFGTLPIINTGGQLLHPEDDLNHTADYDTIKIIYDKLVNARGDFRYPVPTLKLRDEAVYVASIDYNTTEVIIEKKAYDVCKKIGPSAVAFLIGHELTHYYEKHAWRSGFATQMPDLVLSQELKIVEKNDQVSNETQADYLGGFLAYSAGYGLFDKGEELINSLYSSYQLEETLAGYPSKADRITLSKRTAEKLDQLVDVFDMANLLTLLGRHDDAYQFYKYILMQYQSRELYNNIGAAAILSAMPLFDKDSLKFKYVTELDIKFKGSRGVGTSLRDSTIYQGILFFDASISLDPSYAPAYLNKANAYALLGDTKKATFYLEEETIPIAMKDTMEYGKTLSDAYVLQGILAAKGGDDLKAEEYFNKAVSRNSKLGIQNLDILNGKVTNSTIQTSVNLGSSKDTIGSLSLDKYLSNRVIDDKRIFAITPFCTFFQWNEPDNNSVLFQVQNDNTRLKTLFLMTKPNYKGKNILGVKLGDDISKIVSLHNSEPNQSIQTTQGLVLVYNGILYIFDNKNKLIKWVNYTTKRSFL